MTFRELSMTDVREILRRWQAGESARKIALAGVVDRKTAGRYVAAAKRQGVDSNSELTDEIVSRVADAVQFRLPNVQSEAWGEIAKHRRQIEEWLSGSRPLRLVRIHELLVRGGLSASYSTLWRYAHQELGWRERPSTVRIEDPPPGDEVQVDFGKMGAVLLEGGKRRTLWVLIITLSMSRYMFVWPSFTQTVEDLCQGLDAAWLFFGGVTRRVVLDNMAAAVVRAHPTVPELHRAFSEYAQSRGFLVDPARVRRPKDKPRVENQVPYVRERWFDGEVLPPTLPGIREHAERWCRDLAGARVHGTTRRVPHEVFIQEEQPHLLPAPSTPFDVPKWLKAKLHPDHHVTVARALYSAPTRYIGKTLTVRLDRTTVRLYAGHQLVKTHARLAAGERSTDPQDYPQEKADYAFRSVDRVKAEAHEQGPFVGAYADRLLEGPLPWAKMRQGYQLLRLCERYGRQRVNSICERAIQFDVIDVPRIERMLKKPDCGESATEPQGKVIRLPTARFERGASSFATMPPAKSSSEDGGDA